jgi:20S proteasome alpha/beta subunit
MCTSWLFLLSLSCPADCSRWLFLLYVISSFTAAEDYRADDGINLGPQEVYAYLCRVLYNRRNKFDPLWNSLVVAGIEPPSAAAAAADASSSSHTFLGMVGMIGTHYR